MDCRNCGNSEVEKFNFCDACGTPTALFEQSEKTAKFLCFHCGQSMQGSRRFCTHCGNNLEKQALRPGYQGSWTDIFANPRAQVAFVVGTVLFVILPMVVVMGTALREEERPNQGNLPPSERLGSYIIRTVTELAEEEFHQIARVASMAVDREGNIYVSDPERHVVLRKNQQGEIEIYAGSGEAGYEGDGGPAREAKLNAPTDLVVDEYGNLYIADSTNHRVRKVSPDGVIETVAGSGPAGEGQGGYEGDGGVAVAARLNSPTALYLNEDGTIYVADTGNRRIRSLQPRQPKPATESEP